MAPPPAQDLRTGDDRGHQSGDLVGLRVAVELQQVRLQSIEGIDADATAERASPMSSPVLQTG